MFRTMEHWLQEAIDKRKIFDIEIKNNKIRCVEGIIIDYAFMPNNDIYIGFMINGNSKGYYKYCLFSEIELCDCTENFNLNKQKFIQEE